MGRRRVASLSPRATLPVAYPGILFVGGGVQQIQFEDRENGDVGVVAP